jgi:glycosyltransferase involved in cell wall biosynthesis
MIRQYRLQRRRQSLLSHYCAVLVASRHMQEEFRRHGVAEERLHRVPLFPSGHVPDPAPPEERPPTGRVLMVGRLTDLKGGCFLVEALQRASANLGRRLTLVVAGDGPEKAALRTLAHRRGVPADLLGWVSGNRRQGLMREADVLAVPSVWPEPFGLVGIEAGCVGLPAVAYAVGGIPDWLIPGESGELAGGDPPTVGSLSEALVRALSDERHLNRLRHGAWRMAQSYTCARHVGLLESILERAAHGEMASHHR